MIEGMFHTTKTMLVLFVAGFGTALGADPADLVLRGGKVVTLDERHPEAGAIAIRGERIVALGAAQEMEPLIGPKTRVIELNGRMAMPGFIEGHGHFLNLGDSKRKLDLSQAAT